MFTSYLEDKIDERKAIRAKRKVGKGRRSQGQPKAILNDANIESILDDISSGNDRDCMNTRITTLADKAKASIHRRQKLIKIADRSKDVYRMPHKKRTLY